MGHISRQLGLNKYYAASKLFENPAWSLLPVLVRWPRRAFFLCVLNTHALLRRDVIVPPTYADQLAACTLPKLFNLHP